MAMRRSFVPGSMLSMALSLHGGAALAVDTSQWKCETCPFEPAATTAAVEAGVIAVQGTPGRFGDYTGLKRERGYLLLGGELTLRRADGLYGDLSAADLGLDVRSAQGRVGREGGMDLRLAYAESGHVQTEPMDIGYKRSRFDADARLLVADPWSLRLDFRHDVRDGTQRVSGSFFSSAAQLVAPVDDSTSQLGLTLGFARGPLFASIAYRGSVYRNDDEAFRWANPFVPIAGAERGELARPPGNQFHQLAFSGAYEIAAGWRASGDVAWGRMTQDAAFLPLTTNSSLSVGALPASALNGKVDVFDGNVRLTGMLAERFYVNASYVRSVRDNRSPRLSLPAVSADVFADTTVIRINQPFDFTQDRAQLSADYRGPGSLRASVGLDYDLRTRSLQEVVTTRETQAWARIALRPMQPLGLTLKLAQLDKRPSVYGTATWITPPENPLLRKFNLAERVRDQGSVRADLALGESVALGLDLSASRDDYSQSTIGRLEGHSESAAGDLSVTLSDKTQLRAFASSERARARQAGSQAFSQPDWWARSRDSSDVFGVGLSHQALGGRLDLGVDAVVSRSRLDVAIDNGLISEFPNVSTRRESLRLQARYQVDSKLSVLCAATYEHQTSNDWHLDGVQEGAVSNLLVLGEQAPRHNVTVLRLALRYRY